MSCIRPCVWPDCESVRNRAWVAENLGLKFREKVYVCVKSLRIRDFKGSVIDGTSEAPPLSLRVPGTFPRMMQRECKSLVMGRNAAKCCLLDLTWLLHSSAQQQPWFAA